MCMTHGEHFYKLTTDGQTHILIMVQYPRVLQDYSIVGNPNRKKVPIFGFVGIFEYIC